MSEEERQFGWAARRRAQFAHWPLLTRRGLGDWADDIAYDITGGAAADAASGSKTRVTGTSPSASGGGMNFFTAMLGSGNKGNGDQLIAAALAQQSQRSYAPYIIGGIALVGAGFLAYVITRK